MKKLNEFLGKTGILMLLVVITSCGSGNMGDGDTLRQDAMEAKQAMSQADDNIEELFNTSVGYAIFPNVGKGAYIIGGASGNGIVYENGTMIGHANLKQVDIGLQAGGKAYREVLFFQTQEALDDFKDGEYELSASASAVIVERGKSKSITFKDGVGVATMPKAGAMAGVSVGGQSFQYTEQ